MPIDLSLHSRISHNAHWWRLLTCHPKSIGQEGVRLSLCIHQNVLEELFAWKLMTKFLSLRLDNRDQILILTRKKQSLPCSRSQTWWLDEQKDHRTDCCRLPLAVMSLSPAAPYKWKWSRVSRWNSPQIAIWLPSASPRLQGRRYVCVFHNSELMGGLESRNAKLKAW